jgi:hypothetical protein
MYLFNSCPALICQLIETFPVSAGGSVGIDNLRYLNDVIFARVPVGVTIATTGGGKLKTGWWCNIMQMAFEWLSVFERELEVPAKVGYDLVEIIKHSIIIFVLTRGNKKEQYMKSKPDSRSCDGTELM